MTEFSLLSAVLIGLAGGVHCVGMCGGIVGAFHQAIPKSAKALPYQLAYNFGRIVSYSFAGALSGSAGALFAYQVNQGLVILQFISGLMLFALGLYIGQWWQGLAQVEKLGSALWRKLAPISKNFVPFTSVYTAIPYGMIWGWLPCGLVYSTLSWSLASGTALDGALIMLCFGIGTLPATLALAFGFESFSRLLLNPVIKKIIALVLMGMAIYLIINAARL